MSLLQSCSYEGESGSVHQTFRLLLDRDHVTDLELSCSSKLKRSLEIHLEGGFFLNEFRKVGISGFDVYSHRLEGLR
jgi:hypothetical protein